MTRNEKYNNLRKKLLELIEDGYGERCEMKDTDEFPELAKDDKWARCPSCLIYEQVDELFEELDVEEV